MSIFDYINKYKNKDFLELPFTEIDNLILSLLPYIDFTNVVPAFYKNYISLNEATKILEKNKNRGLFIRNAYKLIYAMKDTKRYGNILLGNYMKVINDEMQFGALTIKLSDKSIFIAYAGTDTSIVGWEEDFKLAYLYPGASQKYALIYLNKTVNLFSKKIRIGGHSKGGNLAICAAMNSKFYIRKKIIAIYNNDGPGFLKEQVESKAYKKIKSKINMFVPEESIIGMILYHQENYVVIKSRGFNIIQHDAFNWMCENTKFKRTKLSKRSKNLEIRITEKLESIKIEERIKIVNSLFLLFKDNNIKDTKDIKIKKILNLIKSFNKLDKPTKDFLIEFILILFFK